MSLGPEVAGNTIFVKGPFGTDLQFLNNNDFGYTCGQCVRFLSISEMHPQQNIKDTLFQIPFREYDFFRTIPGKAFFSLTALRDTPLTLIYKYPECVEVFRIEDNSVSELLDICFTYTRLVLILTGQPECQITIWNWETQVLVTKYTNHDIYSPNLHLSCCPCNWRDFCIISETSIKVFTIDHGLPDEDKGVPVVCERPFNFPYDESTQARQINDLFQAVNSSNPADFMSLSAIAQVPPDVSEIFIDEILGRKRFIPTCHTWHVDGALYIGTQEGRLLYFNLHHGVTEPVVLNYGNAHAPIRRILSFKEGLVVLNAEKDVDVLRMRFPTDISENLIIRLENKFDRIWGHPSRERWVGMTVECDLVLFHPNGTLARHLLSRDEISPYTDLERFHDGCFLSLQQHQVFKIWNNDNEALMTCQLTAPIAAMAVCPLYRCVCLGTTDGYLCFLDCLRSVHSDTPRMVHKVRLFSAAVSKLWYDPTGKVLFTVGADDLSVLTILSGSPSRRWAVLGVLRMQATICDLRSVNSNAQLFVMVTLSGTPDKQPLDIVTFRVVNDLLNYPENYFASPLHDFSHSKIDVRKFKLKIPIMVFDLENSCSVFLVTATKHLAHACSDTWIKAPELVETTESLDFPVCHLKMLSGGKYIMLCNKQGTVSLYSTEEKFTLVFEDKPLIGQPKTVAIRQRGLRNRLFILTKEGRLICRSVPVVNDLVTDVWIRHTDDIRKDIEALNGLPTLDSDFLLPCGSPMPQLLDTDAEEEPWLAIKTKSYMEAKATKHTLQAENLKEKYTKLRKRLVEYYTKNTWKNCLERVSEEAFELKDTGWISLRKTQDKELRTARTNAALEMIGHELFKERLLARYWTPLETKLYSIRSLTGDGKIKNFPISKRSSEVMVMENRVQLQRNLGQHVERYHRLGTETDNRKESVKVVDLDTIYTSGEDYTKQTMRLLSGDDDSRVELFDLLYNEDMVTSRFQRIQQLALLRSCGILIKDAFNKRFEAILNEKAHLLPRLHHNYELIEKAVSSRNADPYSSNVPIVPSVLTNDENPGHVLYQVSEEEILQYMNELCLPLPFFLNLDDLNYALIVQARDKIAANAERTRAKANAVNLGKSLSALRIAAHQPKITSPVAEVLINPDEVTRACHKLVEGFQTDFNELRRLKERAVFASSLIDLRAMYIRQRLLYLDQVKSWATDTQNRSARITKITDYVKANGYRAQKMLSTIRDQYHECARRDSGLDYMIKRELHDLSDLDGKRLVSIYRKRPHLFRGLKQATYYEGQLCRPRTAELKEKVTEEFYNSLRMIEDPEQRPEDIDYKVWHKYCEHRRRKMESEMEFWLKHMELELYQGLYGDYAGLEKALQGQVENAQMQLGEIERKQMMLEKNSDFILTVTHGQLEAEFAPFADFNERVILIRTKQIQDMNSDLQNECRKKMNVLEQLTQFREAILLLQWEREVQQEKIVDYEYERNFLKSQVAPREIRKMVGKDLNEYRDEKFLRLKQNLRQQKTTFRKNLETLEYKLQQLYKKLIALEDERHNAEATMRGLTCELQERKMIGENIGVQADVAESEERRNLIWRRLRVQTKVKQQKKRMEYYREELWRWQKRTFPAIYQDLRNP